MKKLVAGALALSMSFSALASADAWELNKHGVPVVSEKSDARKVMAFYEICSTERELPIVVLGDMSIPDSFVGKQVSFKGRVDRNKIYEVTATYVELAADMNGLMLNMDQDAFTTILNGATMRFQFPAQGGGTIVESYSLKGVTQAYSNALLLCDTTYFNNQPNTKQDSDQSYF